MDQLSQLDVIFYKVCNQRNCELCKLLNRILGVTYYPAGWKTLLVTYLHFLKQRYSDCFSEVLNAVSGGKKKTIKESVSYFWFPMVKEWEVLEGWK